VTPPDPTPPIVSVTGGAGGTDAHLDDMQTTAGLIGRLGLDMTELAVVCHGYLADPNVVASAVLDPGGAARFEAAMFEALDGRGGLTAAAVSIDVSAVKLEAAVVAYRTVDELQAKFMSAAEFVAAPFIFAGAIVDGGAITIWHVMHGDSWSQAAQRTLTDHPGLVDELVGSLPGTLADLPFGNLVWAAAGMPTTVPEAAAALARLYPDGSAKVTKLGADDSGGAITPPRTVTDLLTQLGARNGHDGQIDVRIVTTIGPDGVAHKSAIVDIPGTKVWNLPGHDTGSIQDLGTNLHGIANDTTTYEKAVARALHLAGVTADEPVMLVGHSQGGIVATHAASSFTNSGEFHVTNVVTAGAPVGNVHVPPSVQVLSIENSHDIVPHLDAHGNPDQANWTTVTVDEQHGSIGANHAIDKSYIPAAQAVDASHDPSVHAYMDGASGFLDGSSVSTTVYGVQRVP
jgi:hypothetical protein